MSEFKYVIFRRGMFEFPVIFPDKMLHSDIVKQLSSVIPGDPEKSVVAVSAGALHNWDVEVNEASFSSTLGGLMARPEDENLINLYRYGHGIVTEE